MKTRQNVKNIFNRSFGIYKSKAFCFELNKFVFCILYFNLEENNAQKEPKTKDWPLFFVMEEMNSNLRTLQNVYKNGLLLFCVWKIQFISTEI